MHFPVEPRSITPENVAAFGALCDDLKRPMLIFSRSGARSTRIWEMAEALSDG